MANRKKGGRLNFSLILFFSSFPPSPLSLFFGDRRRSSKPVAFFDRKINWKP